MEPGVSRPSLIYSKYVACDTILKIENVLLRTKSGSIPDLISTEFSARISDINKWRFSVELGAEKLRGYLHYSRHGGLVQAWFSLSIIDAEGLKRSVQPLQTNYFADSRGAEFLPFVTLQQLRDDPNLLRNGSELWLHCQVFGSPVLGMVADSLKFQVPVPDCGEEENLTATFIPQHDKFSDVVVAVGDKEIKAHKVILSMCSPVFSAMFESEMEEQKQNRVVITDMDYEIVQQMLCYIYTGKPPKLSEMADQLLMAAEKYSLGGLKSMCEQRLSSAISMETVIQLMSLADLNNANLLKESLNKFIRENFMELMKTASWQKLLYAGSYKLLPNNGFPNYKQISFQTEM